MLLNKVSRIKLSYPNVTRMIHTGLCKDQAILIEEQYTCLDSEISHLKKTGTKNLTITSAIPRSQKVPVFANEVMVRYERGKEKVVDPALIVSFVSGCSLNLAKFTRGNNYARL